MTITLTTSVWIAFFSALAVLLAIDLSSHRGGRSLSRRANLVWSLVWIGAGLGFAPFVAATLGPKLAEEYLAAYFIEKSLSVDNLFVFLVVFRSLGIPEENQRRVLTYGIFGALVFRALFVFVGIAAIARWEWVAYVFAAILLGTAVRVALRGHGPRKSRLVAFLERHLPFTADLEGDRLFVRRGGRALATPLLLALIAIEMTDVLFAVDSVPAALAVSRVPVVVYSSNAFALLGLRSLYALLADALGRLRYLNLGLAGVLAFAGIKILLPDTVHLPALASGLIALGIVGVSVAASLWKDVKSGIA